MKPRSPPRLCGVYKSVQEWESATAMTPLTTFATISKSELEPLLEEGMVEVNVGVDVDAVKLAVLGDGVHDFVNAAIVENVDD
eukprot:5309422-Amphidinium_carterae.1